MTMYLWNVYYKNANTDDPRVFLGVVEACSVIDALAEATAEFDKEEWDLVVERRNR